MDRMDRNGRNEEAVEALKQYLDLSESSDCCVCSEDTEYLSKCCKISLCLKCFQEWLKTSRECMHCHKDQMSFDIWTENYRTETVTSHPLFSAQDLGELGLAGLTGFSATASIVGLGPNNEIIDNIQFDITPQTLLNMFMMGYNPETNDDIEVGNIENLRALFGSNSNSANVNDNITDIFNMMNDIMYNHNSSDDDLE